MDGADGEDGTDYRPGTDASAIMMADAIASALRQQSKVFAAIIKSMKRRNDPSSSRIDLPTFHPEMEGTDGRA